MSESFSVEYCQRGRTPHCLGVLDKRNLKLILKGAKKSNKTIISDPKWCLHFTISS